MIFDDYVAALPGIETLQRQGRVRDLVGLLIASDGPAAAVGDFCEIRSHAGRIVRAQVVGFRDGRVMLMPLEETGGLQLGDTVVARSGSRARRGRPPFARPRARRLRTHHGRRTLRGTGSAVRSVTPRRQVRWNANTSRSRWSPACAPSTVCFLSERASALAFSAAPASARARCWAPWRGTTRPM